MAAKMLKSKWGEMGEGGGAVNGSGGVPVSVPGSVAAAVDSAIASSLRTERSALDLSLSACEAPMSAEAPPPASSASSVSTPITLPACSECRELRKEVREMRDSLHHLITQFHTFASRFPLPQRPSSTTTASLPPNGHAEPAKKARTSPPSSLSSVEAHWPPAAKLEPGEVSSPSGDSRAKLSSPDSASSADSAAVNLAARKRKLSASHRSSSAFKAATAPLPHARSNSLSGLHSPLHQQPVTTPVPIDQKPTLLNNPYFPSLLSNHLLQQQKNAFMPTMNGQGAGALTPWQIQNILLNWQSGLTTKPTDNLLAGLHAQSPFHNNLTAALPLFSSANLLPTKNTPTADQTKTTSSTEVTPSPSSDDNSVSPNNNNSTVSNNNNHKEMGSRNLSSHQRRPSLPTNLSTLDGPKIPASLHHSDVIASLQQSLETAARKKPGPDDFIKEFVESDGPESGETEQYQIPVPEALEADPDFRAASEEEILGSSRWAELDWQEAVTRLAKKLAERRVFGPQLMAKATVAGTNHSNYPNLPTQGIFYIEGVCRKTLFPTLSRREFAEFFRPAVKGLAARCRRIRHSMKPSPSTPGPVPGGTHPLDLAQELLALAAQPPRNLGEGLSVPTTGHLPPPLPLPPPIHPSPEPSAC